MGMWRKGQDADLLEDPGSADGDAARVLDEEIRMERRGELARFIREGRCEVLSAAMVAVDGSHDAALQSYDIIVFKS